MSILWFDVTIPVSVVSPDYTFPAVPPRTPIYSHFHEGRRILSQEFQAWLEGKGFKDLLGLHVLLFYAHPGSKTSVHTDIEKSGLESRGYWALNYTVGDEPLLVRWHKPEGSAEHKVTDLNYKKYPPDTPVVEEKRVKSTVCRIGYPHSSVNDGSTGKWLISLRLHPYNMPWQALKGKLVV